jgi:serine/threonine protein kinase
LVGTVVDDRFEVLSKLGEGGMGAIYKARQISMDRIVALKILLHDQRGDPISVERFRHEAYLASRLNHPNAIVIHDFGQSADGLLYIAMEFLEGETLKERLERDNALSVKSALAVASQTLRVLAEAHRMGLIHRDIKPDNIFLTSMEGDPDFVKVLDFGIAKLTAVRDGFEGYQGGLTVKGKIYGTPKYMSPEQIRGKELDQQSDLYSFGVVLYELLGGRLPFIADTPVDVMMAHLRDPPPSLTGLRSEVPAELENVVLRALEKDRRLRYQNGDEFLEAVENFKFNSGFYAVPARIAARVSESHQKVLPQTMMLNPVSPFGDGPEEDDEDATLMGAQVQAPPADERTVMEFEDEGADARTVFEAEEDLAAPDFNDSIVGDLDETRGSIEFVGESVLQLVDELPADAVPQQPMVGRALESGPVVQDEATMIELDEIDDAESSTLVPIPPDDDSLSGLGLSPGVKKRQRTLLGGPGVVKPPAPPAPPVRKAPVPVKPVARRPAPQPIAAQRPAPAPTPVKPAPSQPAVRPIVAPRQMPASAAPATAAPARLVDAVPDFDGGPSKSTVQLAAPKKSKMPLIIIGVTALLAVAAAVVFFVIKPFDDGTPDTPAAPAAPPVLQFASSPTGVEIFHNNRFIGETPLEHPLEGAATEHKLQLATKTSTFSITVPAQTGPSWVYVQLPPKKGVKLGHVVVASTPPGAEVKLAGKGIGQTPLTVIAADQSALKLSVEKDGQAKPTDAKALAAGSAVEVAF